MTARSPRDTAPNDVDLIWQCVPFEALGVRALQRIYAARQKVFVVEQACAFLDADEHDFHAWHLTACDRGASAVHAYARLLAPGAKYREASIGRVLTTERARGTGLGRVLMACAIEETTTLWPASAIRIGAQARLEAFYEGFGFVAHGARYMEDGIHHVEMVRSA